MNVPHLFKTAGSVLVTVSTVLGKSVMQGAGPSRSDIERTFDSTLSIGFSSCRKSSRVGVCAFKIDSG